MYEKFKPSIILLILFIIFGLTASSDCCGETSGLRQRIIYGYGSSKSSRHLWRVYTYPEIIINSD